LSATKAICTGNSTKLSTDLQSFNECARAR
jgi:hypothetical protein